MKKRRKKGVKNINLNAKILGSKRFAAILRQTKFFYRPPEKSLSSLEDKVMRCGDIEERGEDQGKRIRKCVCLCTMFRCTIWECARRAARGTCCRDL